MKKGCKTEAVGDLLMEPLMKMNHQILTSDFEATLEETPQTPTSSSLNLKKKKSILPLLLNSSPPILANRPSNLDLWLEQWHRSHLQPPSLTAWWPEPWELEYPKEGTPPVLREFSGPFSPHNTIEEIEVEMILLNLTDEILENAKKEGQEVVEVEMTWGVVMGVVEVEEEADLILQVMEMQPIPGHYWTR